MQNKATRALLVGLPIAAFLIMFFINTANYMGVYEDIVQVVLLAVSAIFLPSLLGENSRLPDKWVSVIGVAMCAVSVGLFLLTKPAYTTKQASQLLLDSGYKSITVPAGKHIESIDDGKTFFVNDGYVYTCTDADGQSETVLFNPQTGSWSVIE
ncbi:MAG: hypothetical protein IJY66_00165 [Clostridia bacterium]|nr:hypothetical protein [Clostridia bacterium]